MVDALPAAALRGAAAPSPATLGRVDPQALELSKQPLSVLRSHSNDGR